VRGGSNFEEGRRVAVVVSIVVVDSEVTYGARGSFEGLVAEDDEVCGWAGCEGVGVGLRALFLPTTAVLASHTCLLLGLAIACVSRVSFCHGVGRAGCFSI